MFKKKIKVHIYKNEISLVLKALNELNAIIFLLYIDF